MGGQSRHCIDGKRKPRREVVAVASNQPHTGTVALRQNAKTVMFDFMEPARPEGGALAGEGKHGSIIPSPGRVRSRNDIMDADIKAARGQSKDSWDLAQQFPREVAHTSNHVDCSIIRILGRDPNRSYLEGVTLNEIGLERTGHADHLI